MAVLTTAAAIVSKKLFPKTLVKLIAEFALFFINVFCLCMFDWWGSQKSEKKKLRTRDTQKKRYGKDVLAMLENPRYNAISDPTFDLDKYKQISAGVMFLCEGEVLLVQRNTKKLDAFEDDDGDDTFCFGLPGGTVMYEDFDQYYNSLLTRKEYKKKLKEAPKEVKQSIEAHASSFAAGVFETVDGIGDSISNFANPQASDQEVIMLDDLPDVELDDSDGSDNDNDNENNSDNEDEGGDGEQGNTDGDVEEGGGKKKKKKGKKKGKKGKKGKKKKKDKDAKFPQVPLYDAFFPHNFSLEVGSSEKKDSLRSMKASKKKKNKNNNARVDLQLSFEQSIRHYNHGFGFDGGTWHGAVRSAREDLGDSFPNLITPIAIFNLYRGGFSSVDPRDDESESDDDDIDVEAQALIQESGSDFKVSLLGNGKVVADNFRRYTLYLCNITPDERNHMMENTDLVYGWFPLTLLLSMHTTFRQFSLHPWVTALIQQYSTQFDKLARPTYWVGFNRHFHPQPLLPAVQQQLLQPPSTTADSIQENKRRQEQKKKSRNEDYPNTSVIFEGVTGDIDNDTDDDDKDGHQKDQNSPLDQEPFDRTSTVAPRILNLGLILDQSATNPSNPLGLSSLGGQDQDHDQNQESTALEENNEQLFAGLADLAFHHEPPPVIPNSKPPKKKLDPYAFERDIQALPMKSPLPMLSPAPPPMIPATAPTSTSLVSASGFLPIKEQGDEKEDGERGGEEPIEKEQEHQQLQQQYQQQPTEPVFQDYYDTDEPIVEYDPNDVFTRFFLGLVRKYIDPKVYT